MFRKRPIHPLIQFLVTLSLLLVPLLTALPVSAGGAVDLWISSASGSPDPVRAGNTLTYTFVVNGNTVGVGAFLEDVRLYVYLPPWVTPTGVSSRPFSILPDGSILFDLGSYPVGSPIPGGGATCSLEVRVADDAVAQVGAPFDMVATAWVTSNNYNLMGSGPDQAVVTTRVNERADLQVVKVRVPDLDPNFIIAGQTILYEVTVRNTGPSAARNVVLYDWAVEGDPNYDLELISSSVACQTLVGAAGSGWFQVTGLPLASGGENVYACPLGTVGADEERTYQFLYRVPSGMSVASNDIVNFAEVLSTNKMLPVVPSDFATPDPDVPPLSWPLSLGQVRTNSWDNMAATADTNVWAQADISVTKTAWPDPVIAGQKVWYQVTVTNNGPSDAATVTVTDTLPVSVTYIANDNGCVLSPIPGPNGEQQVVCTVPSLAVGKSATFVIEGYVDPAAYYNQLPPPPGEEPRLTNRACATIQEMWIGNEPVYIDPDHDNNCTTQYTFLDELADLRLTKVSKPDDEVRAGETFTYTIIVDNYGPSVARNVVITDTLLNSGLVTIQGCAFSVSQGGGTITQFSCTTGPVVSTQFGSDVGTFATDYLDPRGPSSQGRLRASFRLTANEAIDLDNFATVVAETPDPDMANNEAWNALSVTAVADLEIGKERIDPPTIEFYTGDPITYALYVSNNGPSTAENVVVKDYLPAGVVLLSITATGGTPFSYTGGTPGDPTDPLVINLGTVPAGWSDTFEIELLVDPSVRGRISGMAQYGFMRNDASIESDTFDDDWSDNLASWLDKDVLNLSYIFVEKDGPKTAVAGTEIEYEIFVENRGPSTAFNLRVKDWLGPESQQYLTFLGYYVENASGVSCTYSEHWGGVFCNRGDMVPHNGFGTPEGFSIYLRFLVDPSTPVGTVLTDTVEILTDNWEWEYITQIPDPSDPTKFTVVDSVLNWETEITAEANLVAIKASVPQKVVAGEQVKYVLTVTNNGPSDAKNVFVVDHFGEWPNELEFEVSSDPKCQLDVNNHVNCQVGTLPAGATWTADIWGRVKPSVFPGTVITNRVAVRSDTPPYTADPDKALWTATETYVLNAADLKVQKFGKPDGEVRAGDLLTYTIIVDNLGPSDAWGPAVQDMLRSDGNFTLVSISSSRPNDTVCSVTPPVGSTDGALDFTCSLVENSAPAPLVVSDRWVLTVVVTANETQDINNTVRVWSDYGVDPDTSNNYAMVEHDITDVSDLVVKKEAMGLVAPGEWEKDAVTAGLSMVYTMTVTNFGPSTAENVVLEDRLPSWLVVTGVEASQGACNTGTPGSAEDKLVCGLGTLGVGETVTVVVMVDVPSWIAAGTILENDVLVYSDIFDPLNANNYATNLTEVSTLADLVVEKDEEPDPVVAGEIVDWAFRVTNEGPSDAVHVVAVDTLPGAVEFLSASVAMNGANCTYSAAWHLVTCDLGTLGAGETVVVLIRTRVKSDAEEGYITNSVAVASDPMGWGSATPDPDEDNNADSTDTMVVNKADLAIQKVGLPEKVYAGEQIRYEITVTNNGPSDARNVVVTDVLDDQVAFELTNGDCAYDAQTGEADCGYLPVGMSKSFYVWVRVDADVEPGTTIENTAVVGSDTDDPDETNNSVTIGNYVMSKADLRIVKFGKPDGEVRAGEYLTYTIIVDNLGPSWAWGVTLEEVLRSDGQFWLVSVESSRDADCPIITAPQASVDGAIDFTCELDDPMEPMTEEGAGRWIVTVVVTANETQDINNVATVFAEESEDPDPSNNQAVVEHDITDVADLSVVKTEMGYAYDWANDMFQVVPAEDSAIAGYEGGLAYTMVVRNDGPSTAENVVLQDRLPAWVTVTGYEATQGSCATGTPGSAEDKLTCGLGTIVPGGVVTVTVYGYVPHWVTEGTILENDVLVYSDIFDPDNSDNLDTNLTTVWAFADLAVEKMGPATINAGEVIEYIVGAINQGVSTAQDVVLADYLPDQVSYLSHRILYGNAYCGVANGVIGCDLGDMAPGQQVAIAITGLVDPGFSGVITNTAEVFSLGRTTDPYITDNGASLATEVNPLADLQVVKMDRPDPAIAGQMLYYTIVATNNGPSDATNVWVTDTLPAEVTFVDATEGGVYDADTHTVTWYLGDMPVGTSKTVEVHVQVNTDARIVMEGPLANTVVVMGDESDPDEANNTYVEETFVNDLADLRITKVGKPDGEVRAGEPLYYTIYVDNLGPSDARDVVVTDNILSNLEFRVSDITTSQGITRTEDGVLYFELGILPAGARATMTMIVTADETQDVNNIASVYATTPDPDYSNNQVIVMTAITDVSDLGITKEIVGGELIAGTNVIYEIVVWNDGPSTAENVVVKDWLPGGTMPMSDLQGLPMGAQYTWGTPGDPTNPAILNLGTLAPGERYTITLELAIDQAYGSNLLANDVEISSDIFDPENGNNRASAVLMVEEKSELTVLKWDTPDPVMAGTTVEYFIGVQNTGPSAVRNLKIFDWVSGAEWLTLKEYKIGNGSGYCLSNQTWATVDCYLGDVAAGDWREVYLTFEVSPDAPNSTVVHNEVELDADSSFEIVEGSDLDEETTIMNVADLAVTKTVSPAPVAYTGEGVAYEITVTNMGPGTAFGVVVTDTLPSGMSFVVASGLCDFAAGGTLLPPTPGGTPFVCNLGNVAVGQSLTFTIYAKVDPDAEPGIYTNVVEVAPQGESLDLNEGNNIATAQVEVQGKADLKVLKFGKPEGDVWAGDLLTYTIIVDNLGPGDAQGVILKELMRSSGEFNLVSVSSDRDIDSTAWSGTFSGDFEFEITLEDPLEVGGRWLVEIVVEADETQDINNCVTVVSDYMDPNTADNNSCAAHAITDRADLAISKYAEGFMPTGCEYDLRAWAPGEYMPRGNPNGGYLVENEVAAGSWLWYELWVENEGPSTAENVVAVDYLPLGLVYRGAWYYVEEDDDWYAADCTVNQTLDRVTCNLGSLAPGEGVEIWIALDVPSWMPEGTELWNTARVYSDIYDHNNANDTANNLTTVHAVADIAVTKESVPETALPWQEISYVITVENLGPSDAPGTLVHDVVPSKVSGVIWSAEFFGGATGNPSGNWAIHEMVNLPAGSKVVYTVHGMLDTYWPVTNTVEVMTAENVWDPCDENNSATDVNAPKLNFLPILFKQASRVVELPNLVVERIVATPTGIQVDVKNIGDAPVYQGFWVDLYVNPPVAPTRVNQIWNDPEGDGTYCSFPVCQGLAWGVTGNSLPLNPGDLLILRVDDSYPKINWPLNAGDVIYAQVDSWNPETDYGTVIETHEAYGGPYDNIRWATRVLYRLSEGAGHAAIAGQGVSFDDLPARP